MKLGYTAYDPESGKILRAGTAPNEATARLQGKHVLLGVIGDRKTQIVVDGKLAPRPLDGADLAAAKDESRSGVDRGASKRRMALMPIDDLLLLMAEAIADPAGPARAQVQAWLDDATAIEAERKAAHTAIDKAETVAEAHDALGNKR